MAIRQIGAGQTTDPMQMLFLMMQMEENRADRRREERKFDLQMKQMEKQLGAEDKKNRLLEFQTLLKGIQDDESLSDDERKSATKQLYYQFGFNFPGADKKVTKISYDPYSVSGAFKRGGIKDAVGTYFKRGSESVGRFLYGDPSTRPEEVPENTKRDVVMPTGEVLTNADIVEATGSPYEKGGARIDSNTQEIMKSLKGLSKEEQLNRLAEMGYVQ